MWRDLACYPPQEKTPANLGSPLLSRLCCPMRLACSPGHGWCIMSLCTSLSDRATASLLTYFAVYHITNSTGHIAKAAKPKSSEQKCAIICLWETEEHRQSGAYLGTANACEMAWRNISDQRSAKYGESFPPALQLVPSRPVVKMMGWRTDIVEAQGVSTLISILVPWSCTDSSTFISPWSQ